MKKEQKRFRLEKFRFETDMGGFTDRFMITDRQLPMLEVNQWVEAKNLRKTSTGREYAGKLTVFLNYLDSVNLEYDAASNTQGAVLQGAGGKGKESQRPCSGDKA